MANQYSIELYSSITKLFENLSKDFDKLHSNKGTSISLKKGGIIITIDYKDFKKKK